MSNRYGRELASRVEIEFHKKPNWFKRITWISALVASIVAAVWILNEGRAGNTRIYEAGEVSTPHRMFEQDCTKCHSLDDPIVAPTQTESSSEGTWAPVKRLLTMNDGVHSVSNANCQACHIGPDHRWNQNPIHGDEPEELSCAKCHREHEGDAMLARVADRHCVDCHGDLKEGHGDDLTFAGNITNFSDPEGHPEFYIEQLLKQSGDVDNVPTDDNGKPVHYAHRVLGFEALDGEPARWRDKARIRFNHAAHLKMMFDENGNRLKGTREENIKRRKGLHAGDTIGYPHNCTECHEFDTARQYMKPINYEKHCSSCHPLNFDVDLFTTKEENGVAVKQAVTVPHESPDVVRGFLAKIYAIDSDKTGRNEEADDAASRMRLGFPGRDFPLRMNAELAKQIHDRLDADAKMLYSRDDVKNELARRKGETVLFKENGSCALCHDVRQPSQAKSKSWEIVPPNIPDRWYGHSRFKHDSHRMLSCMECHSDLKTGKPVYESVSTGDVLMPGKANCLECHQHGVRDSEDTRGSQFLGARADCVECHGYHNHAEEDFDGNLNVDLTLRKDVLGTQSKENDSK